jgi:hypothetical protein
MSTSIFLHDGPPIAPEIPTIADKTPIKINGEMSKLIEIASNINPDASINLVINKITFLEYLSASIPPIGAAKGCINIGIDASNPTIKDELVFSKTYQLTKINLKKKVENARAPEIK